MFGSICYFQAKEDILRKIKEDREEAKAKQTASADIPKAGKI